MEAAGRIDSAVERQRAPRDARGDEELPPIVSPGWIRGRWLLRQEIALVDLRGEGRHAEGHPLFATCIPYTQLELRIGSAVPRLSTSIVLLHDDDTVAARAFEILTRLGYGGVAVLGGGVTGWTEAGFELFADVNSPSKAFGELVAERKHTPLLPALALKQKIEQGDDIVIWDARTFDEYRMMSIPGGISVPGADLVATAERMPPDPQTEIIVNCAGRTRSIVGAQSLINAGIRNRVHALRNGTIGWSIESLALETGQTGAIPDLTEPDRDVDMFESRDVAYRAGVRWIEIDELRLVQSDPSRTWYGFDLRPAKAFAAAHIPGFVNIAGGQLVQETDMNAAVRGARIILYDDIGTRANMTGSWLAQMGWDCCILSRARHAEIAGAASGFDDVSLPDADWTDVGELSATAGATIVDLGSSSQMSLAHIPGSIFVPRDRLDAFVQDRAPRKLVLVSVDGKAAAFAARDVRGHVKTSVLSGGRRAWIAAGQPTASGPFAHFGPIDDVYRRPYVGTDNPVEAMQAYLDWEYGLVAQLERDGSHGFYVI